MSLMLLILLIFHPGSNSRVRFQYLLLLNEHEQAPRCLIVMVEHAQFMLRQVISETDIYTVEGAVLQLVGSSLLPRLSPTLNYNAVPLDVGLYIMVHDIAIIRGI